MYMYVKSVLSHCLYICVYIFAVCNQHVSQQYMVLFCIFSNYCFIAINKLIYHAKVAESMI